jgi:hypothetical protein
VARALVPNVIYFSRIRTPVRVERGLLACKVGFRTDFACIALIRQEKKDAAMNGGMAGLETRSTATALHLFGHNKGGAIAAVLVAQDASCLFVPNHFVRLRIEVNRPSQAIRRIRQVNHPD